MDKMSKNNFTICPNCGTPNNPKTLYCEKCHQPLIQPRPIYYKQHIKPRGTLHKAHPKNLSAHHLKTKKLNKWLNKTKKASEQHD